MKKLLFVVNPIANGTDKADITGYLSGKAAETGYAVHILETSGSDDVQAVQQKVKNIEPELIVVGGGDGTVQMLCTALYKIDCKTTVGILPLGSANGLATSLGLAQNAREAVDWIFENPNSQDFDLLQVNNKYCCVHLLDMGLNAALVKRYENSDSRGILGYAKHVFDALKTREETHFDLQLDGEAHKKSGQLLVCTNANRYGTGVALTSGKPNDGLLDLRVIPKVNLEELIQGGLTLVDLFSEQLKEDSLQGRELSIQVNRPIPLQIDGEFIGDVKKVEVRVLPNAIKMRFPDGE
ncbi:MAG: diacylglycerol/lipid kinase family protein [Luteibaculum sp.]